MTVVLTYCAVSFGFLCTHAKYMASLDLADVSVDSYCSGSGKRNLNGWLEHRICEMS